MLTCDVCNIPVNTSEMLAIHMRGKKHLNRVRIKAALSRNERFETELAPVDSVVVEKLSKPTECESLDFKKEMLAAGTLSKKTGQAPQHTVGTIRSLKQLLKPLEKFRFKCYTCNVTLPALEMVKHF